MAVSSALYKVHTLIKNNVDNQRDTLTAYEAKEEAQRLAFAPVAFQACYSLRTLGILDLLAEQDQGLSLQTIAEHVQLSPYGISVLLDMAASVGVIIVSQTHYQLTKMGHFLQGDPMTMVNFDFVANVCYEPMRFLTDSVQSGRPEGLSVFGEWQTIYPGLSQLPEPAKQSWFKFDHYYSDRSFSLVLDHVFKTAPQTICDIGANTGKWTTRLCDYSQQVTVTMVDLQQQLVIAQKNILQTDYADRVRSHTCDLLDKDASLPVDQDAYWMSQFLDCFSKKQIINILQKVKLVMHDNAEVFILELFPDRQQHHSATYSLNATSLYFTAIANGYSRFYQSTEFLPLIEQAGLQLTDQIDHIGLGHTLLKCKKNG